MTDTVNVQLLPCPFCGGEASIERYGNTRVSTQYHCDDCGCFLETGEEFNHVRSWNTRATLAAAPKVEQEPVGEIAKVIDFASNPTEVVWTGKMPPIGTKLYTHPAPASDELLEALVDLASWFIQPLQGLDGLVWVIPAGERGADDALEVARSLIAKHKGPQS